MRLGLVPIAGAFSVLACGGDSTSPEGAHHLVFKVQPSTVAAGQVIAPPVQVELETAAGDVVTSGTPTITLGLEPSGSGATLNGQLTHTASGGVAVFSDLSIIKSGVFTLIAVTPEASGATSSGFNVRPLEAKTITAAGGDGQQAGVGSPVSHPPSVKATDVFGNPVPGVSVTFAVASGGGTLEGAQQTTGSDGIAMVESWSLGSSPGTNTVEATSGGLAGSPVLFSATATPLATAVTVEVHNDFFRSVRNGSVSGSDLFEYAVDTIAAGGTVTWVWMGQNHNVTPSFSGSSLSGNQDAPYTLGPITFSTPGRYEYRCTNHSHFLADIVIGMAGRIVIR